MYLLFSRSLGTAILMLFLFTSYVVLHSLSTSTRSLKFGVQSHIVENIEIENAYRYEISDVEGVFRCCVENSFYLSYSHSKQEAKTL